MNKYQPVMTVDMIAKEPLCEGVLVNLQGKIARQNDVVCGVCGQDSQVDQSFPCHAIGVFELMAGEDIQAGTLLGSNEQGRVSASGYKPFARALADALKGETILVCTSW